MKRLSLIVIFCILLIACGRQKPPVKEPEVTGQVLVETIEAGEPTSTKPPKEPVKPREWVYEDYKKAILDQLAYLKAFDSKTDVKVVASGGSFLMPGFEVTMDKTLKFVQRPLSAHVTINTSGPFFLNLGPSKVEVYTKDGDVYTYDEKTNKDVKADLRPHQVRERYDVETTIQQKLWREKKFELQTGNRLIAKLRLKGNDAQELVSEILKKYGVRLEFDEVKPEDGLELTLEYDPKTYHPKVMKIEGVTWATGYKLDLQIDVNYTNVK